MRLVTFEPAAGCERLGVWVSEKIVDLAEARVACQAATKGQIPELPSDMMAFLNQGESAVKAFDSSLPMGPCLTMKDEIEDPHKLHLQVRVNGKVVQETSTGEMVFKIPETIEFLSDFITLDPGDIIATGTPGGSNDPLKKGDQVDVEITNIGVLRSFIADIDR